MAQDNARRIDQEYRLGVAAMSKLKDKGGANNAENS